MFPFPSSPSPPRGPRSSPGVTPEERGKVVLLGALFLACLGMLAFFYTFLRSRSATAPQPSEAPVAPPTGPLPEIQVVPLFPEEEGPELEAGFLEDIAKLPAVVDGVDAADPEVYDYLIDQSLLNARVLNLGAEGFDRDPDADLELLRSPEVHPEDRHHRHRSHLEGPSPQEQGPPGGGQRHPALGPPQEDTQALRRFLPAEP